MLEARLPSPPAQRHFCIAEREDGCVGEGAWLKDQPRRQRWPLASPCNHCCPMGPALCAANLFFLRCTKWGTACHARHPQQQTLAVWVCGSLSVYVRACVGLCGSTPAYRPGQSRNHRSGHAALALRALRGQARSKGCIQGGPPGGVRPPAQEGQAVHEAPQLRVGREHAGGSVRHGPKGEHAGMQGGPGCPRGSSAAGWGV